MTQDGDRSISGLEGSSIVSINPDENGEPLVLDTDGIRRIQPSF